MAKARTDPLKILQDELKENVTAHCIHLFERIGAIGQAIGQARVKTELLPLLIEYCEFENDETRAALARHVNSLIDSLGGGPNGSALLPILTRLCEEEEAVVREAAAESLAKLIPQLPRPEVAGTIFALIKKYCADEYFAPRQSACHLLAPSLPALDATQQAEAKQLYKNLCSDECQLVRKAALVQLPEMCRVMSFQSELHPLLKAAAAEDLDGMRVTAVDTCATLVSLIDAADYANLLLPLIEGFAEDSSWKSRLQLAMKSPQMCHKVDTQLASKRFLPLMARLLRDKEPDVRVKACESLPAVIHRIGTGILEGLDGVWDALASDPSVSVRVAFAKSVVSCFIPVTPKEVAAKVLVPLLTQLTRDEQTDVRYSAVADIDALQAAVGPAAVSTSIYNILMDLASDAKWRVRGAVLSSLPILSKLLGVKTFEKKFQSILMAGLADRVAAVRVIACQQVGPIVREFGGKWAADKLFPPAWQLYDKNANYLQRMTCLQMAAAAAPVAGLEVAEKSLLPIVLQGVADDVANVRVSAVRALGELALIFPRDIVASRFQPIFAKLARDPDPDVIIGTAIYTKRLFP